jgi:hypothetical protein
MIRSCLGKCKHGYLFFLTKILPPYQNIGKSWSTKVNVFGFVYKYAFKHIQRLEKENDILIYPKPWKTPILRKTLFWQSIYNSSFWKIIQFITISKQILWFHCVIIRPAIGLHLSPTGLTSSICKKKSRQKTLAYWLCERVVLTSAPRARALVKYVKYRNFALEMTIFKLKKGLIRHFSSQSFYICFLNKCPKGTL